MKRVLILLLCVFLALVLLVTGYLLGQHRTSSSMNRTAAVAGDGTAHEQDKKILYWYDTMVPQEHFDKPGLSPMGMQMVPKYVDDSAITDAVRIDPGTVQNLGIRTAAVERRALASVIQVPGIITWDLRLSTTVSARVDGVVSTLFVRAPYTSVKKGEPLVTLLAPQWNSALAEYGALEHAQSADARTLRIAARERLQVLGLTGADIRQTGHGSGIILHAPQTGTVATLDVREGQRVSAGQTLMTLNGLATVWVDAALPQNLAGTVQTGTPVSVTVDAQPGRTFNGSVETVLPDIDATTRTQRARIVLDNRDGALSPGMFAQVQLRPAGAQAQLVVPSEALIASGNRARVIVAESGGHFRAVSVRTGRSAGGYTEVLSGLNDGQQIVVSGQFLIDSEANLSGALGRLDGGAVSSPASVPAPPTSAPMSGMSMGGQP
ncbi:MAG TPA: efflux RND transporter periplasmic adaptor subunit [Rhodanobacter sp.]